MSSASEDSLAKLKYENAKLRRQYEEMRYEKAFVEVRLRLMREKMDKEKSCK